MTVDNNVAIGSKTLTFAGAGKTSIAGTISGGTLSGTGGLTLSGPGELILSGTNTYTGRTLVDDGTLVDAASEAIPDGTSLTVGAGARLVFDSTQAAGPVQGSAIEASAAGVIAVPEPGAAVLLFAAAALLAVHFRRR